EKKMKKNPRRSTSSVVISTNNLVLTIVFTIVSGIFMYLFYEQIICSGWGCVAGYWGIRILTIVLASVSLVLLFVLIYRFWRSCPPQKKVS
ncbi:unnamed protein product, partial [marine sediment metagenome]